MLNTELREEPQRRATRETGLWSSYRRKATHTQSETALVEQYLPLVKTAVGRLQMSLPTHVETEDLYSAGLIGLLDAIRHYKPKLGARFENYARVRIRGAVLDELRHMDWVPRSIHTKAKRVKGVIKQLEEQKGRIPTDMEVAGALGLPIKEYQQLLQQIRPATLVCLDAVEDDQDHPHSQYEAFAHTKQESPFEGAVRNERSRVIGQWLQNLPEMQRKVLALYYFEDFRLREIAEVFSVTQSRICQIHSQAILSLKAHYEDEGVSPIQSGKSDIQKL